tara:strand:- start:1682 stop:2359 length:678 start_codon:yes stop_codon:yes gene_type:complete
VIVFLQARCSSKRLPNKVIKTINDKPMFLNIIDSLKNSKLIKKIIVTTSNNKTDDKLVSICKKNKIEYFRGNLENVSRRLKDLLIKLNFKKGYFMRISADSPLIDFKLINKFIKITYRKKPDILTNTFKRSFPKGQSIELIKSSVFLKNQKKFKINSDKEHITTYFYRNYKKFKIFNIENKKNYSNLNMSVDTKSDMIKMRQIFKKISKEKKYIPWTKLIKYFND